MALFTTLLYALLIGSEYLGAFLFGEGFAFVWSVAGSLGFAALGSYVLYKVSERPFLKGLPQPRATQHTSPLTIACWLVALVFAGVSGLMLARATDISGSGWDVDITLNWSTVFITVAFVCVASFISGLPRALSVDPPLLPAKITLRGESGSGEVVLEGKLLARSDGVWYFFDPQNTLVGVSDAKVEIAAHSQDTVQS